MKRWFKKYGLLFYPISWQGFLITLLAIAFCVQIFTAIDRESHSITDTLYGIYPYWVSTVLAWLWIADKASVK